MQVAQGIYRIKSPLPFPPHFIYCYAIENGGDWLLVDAGLNYQPAQAVWLEAFKALDMKPGAIKAIYITHFHPDHYGAAGWLQNLSGAPVYMHPLDARLCELFWKAEEGLIRALREHFIHNGLEPVYALELVEDMSKMFPLVKPAPEITLLPEKQESETVAGQMKICWTPGHSDGHICLFEEREGVLLAGDHLLDEITPNISYWPGANQNPLKNYLESMDALEKLPIRLALPGHGQAFQNVRERIEQIKSHCRHRLEIVAHEAGGGRTAKEICARVFDSNLSPLNMRLAMGEALSHLKYLEREGLVHTRRKNSTVFYFSGPSPSRGSISSRVLPK